jgi:hypothetical protein
MSTHSSNQKNVREKPEESISSEPEHEPKACEKIRARRRATKDSRAFVAIMFFVAGLRVVVADFFSRSENSEARSVNTRSSGESLTYRIASRSRPQIPANVASNGGVEHS